MSQGALIFEKLLDSARRSAVHLEMRDVYAVDEEREHCDAWKRGARAGDPEAPH